MAEYDNYGYIDTTGTMVVPLVFRWASSFSEGLACVSTEYFNEAPFYIDKSGRVALNPGPWKQTALAAMPFTEGLAAVKWYRLNGAHVWGFINRDGKQAFERVFADARTFAEGMAAVQGENGKWGYIDRAGTNVIDFSFDYAFEFSEGLAQVRTGGKIGFIDRGANYVIEPAELDGWAGACIGGLIRVQSVWPEDDIRYLDRKGKVVWPPAG